VPYTIDPIEGLDYVGESGSSIMIKGMTAILATAISLVFLTPPAGDILQIVGRAAYAQDSWKTEFEAVCARTQEAAGMTPEELKNLVNRCDKLRPQIEKLDETQKKVYTKRLKMCRDLYAFVLETKEKQ
jgi:hypothetical protein